MQKLHSTARSVIPAQIRKHLRAAQQTVVFRRAMKHFLKDLGACARPGSRVLNDLIYGWGNAIWSAGDEYLAASIQLALITPGPILECGSGLSTVLVGAVAQSRGLRHWVLEDHPDWVARVQQCLNDYHLHDVKICGNPLKDYGDFCWYDPPLEGMPAHFSLVICDGPPMITTKGGRYGLAPVMQDRLSADCTILLDDASREHERALASRWAYELGVSVERRGSAKPFFEMKRMGNAQPR